MKTICKKSRKYPRRRLSYEVAVYLSVKPRFPFSARMKIYNALMYSHRPSYKSSAPIFNILMQGEEVDIFLQHVQGDKSGAVEIGRT